MTAQRQEWGSKLVLPAFLGRQGWQELPSPQWHPSKIMLGNCQPCLSTGVGIQNRMALTWRRPMELGSARAATGANADRAPGRASEAPEATCSEISGAPAVRQGPREFPKCSHNE